MNSAPRESNAAFGTGLARAFAGAVIFGLPLLMTMEMWWLGFTMEPWKLALFLVLFFPFLVLLSWHAGFEATFSWRDDVVDALVAYAVGFTSAASVLALLGLLERQMTLADAMGKISLQAVPGSIGALLAQSMLGQEKAAEGPERGGTGYASDLFVMGVGALFLAFNIAPTEEMLLIAIRMTDLRALLVAGVSVALMHAFMYGVAFHGQPENPQRHPGWSLFLRFTVVGYVLACVLSIYLLWSFGRLEGMSAMNCMKAVIVLAFPAAIGAAAARLIL